MNRRFWALLLVFALCLTLFVACDAPKSEETSGETESVGTSSKDETDGVSESTSLGESDDGTESDGVTEGGGSEIGETDNEKATESESEASTLGEQTESETETEKKVIEVDSVSLNRATLSLKVGERKSISATVSPENADNVIFVWTSSNEDIVMVSSSGSVYAVAVGQATVTVSVGEKSASCQVTVTNKSSGGGSQRPEETTEGWTESNTEYPWWDETEYPWWEETETETWWPSTETEYPWWEETTEWRTESATEYPWWDETEKETNYDFESSVETDEVGEEVVVWKTQPNAGYGEMSYTVPNDGYLLFDYKVGYGGVLYVSHNNLQVLYTAEQDLYQLFVLSVKEGDEIDFTYVPNYKSGYACVRNIRVADINYGDGVGLAFKESEDGESFILTGRGDCTDNCIRVPETYNGKPVVRVEEDAFYNDTQLFALVIPNSVTSIGEYALYGCSNLCELSIPFVGSDANWSESALFGHVFGARESSEYDDYIPASLKTVNITGGESIASYAFAGCDYIQNITVAAGVSEIGEYAFINCSGLKNVILSDSVTSIGRYAFCGCGNLTDIDLPSSLESIDEGVFRYCYSLESIEIPYGVTSIGDYAFANCSSLQNVILPNSVTSIGNYSFAGCSSLESLPIPDGLVKLGNNAFDGCNVEYTEYENARYMGSEENKYAILVSCTDVNLKEYVVHEDAKIIMSRAFADCRRMESITLPGKLAFIGAHAFEGCEELNSVYINDIADWVEIVFEEDTDPENWYPYDDWNSIPSSHPLKYANNLFLNGELIEELVIPEGVEYIAEFAFYNCNTITSVKIPTSLKRAGRYVFYGCEKMETVHITDIASWCNVQFYEGGSFQSAYGFVSSNPMEYADNLYLNGELITELVIPDGVTRVPRYAFNSTSITSVFIPDSVTEIAEFAFGASNSLTSVVFEDPNGWLCFGEIFIETWGYELDTIVFQASDLANSDTVAEYFNSTYRRYYWTKE